MNKTSLLMLVVGTILGVVIGYVTFSAKPATPEAIIEAYGFRNIDYEKGKVNIELVKRVDADNLEAFQIIQMPTEGFARGFRVSREMIKTLVKQGLVKESVFEPVKSNETNTQE